MTRLRPSLIPWLPAVVLCVVLAATYAVGVAATPRVTTTGMAVALEDSLPQSFGDWQLLPSSGTQVGVSTTADDPNMDQPYDQLVMRSYRNGSGQVIAVAVAWGESQRQEIKIHRPELCYPAQGYRITELLPTAFPELSTPERPVTGKRMGVVYGSGAIVEAVVYWIRIGTVFSDSAWETRGHIVREGLQGRIPDGILVRLSMRASAQPESMERAYRQLEAFATELTRAAPAAPLIRSTAELALAAR